jgi:hypothetical protein
MIRKTNAAVNAVLLLIFISWLSWFVKYREYERNHIVWDVISYYSYLPATFIENDLKLSFIDHHEDEYSHKYWPERTAAGAKVIKTTCGLSILYLPFFLGGHAVAKLTGAAADGFSVPYQFGLLLGSLFYVFIGLVFLRKLLLFYFNDLTVAITLLVVFLGTNLFWYSTRDALMPHAFLFSIISVLLYNIKRWNDRVTFTRTLITGLLFGLLCLIRPTMIFLSLIFLLYDIRNFTDVKRRSRFFWSHRKYLLVLVTGFIIPIIPQLLYWHYNTGQWIFYSYGEERFYWNHPHIYEGLIGFRKGWLLYTPVMILAITGFFVFKKFSEFKSGVLTVFIILLIVNFSWWAWWYGGSFGQRSMIDIYPLLAIPFANFISNTLNKSKLVRTGTGLLLVSLIYINVFQTWQFERGIIHYDGMTLKSYGAGFLKRSVSSYWWAHLKQPDYDRARAGLNESRSATSPGREVLAFDDFELYPERAELVQDSIFYSAKYSQLLNAQNPYTRPIILSSAEYRMRHMDSVFINLKFYPLEKLSDDDILVIFQSGNDTLITVYLTTSINTENAVLNQWFTTEANFKMPNLEEKQQVRVYAWNRGRKKVYTDDIVIEFTRAKYK